MDNVFQKVTCISHVALIETEHLVHFVKNSLSED